MKRQSNSNLILLRLAFVAMLLLYSFWLRTNTAHASTTIFSETFDSPLGTNWQVVMDRQTEEPDKPCMNRGAYASWVQVQNKMKLEIEGPSCVIDFAPSNLDLRGLASYQARFQLTEIESTLMDRAFTFLWQDPKNWYDLKLYGNTVLIQKVVNGLYYQLPNSQRQFPFQVNREYDFSIDVTPEQHIMVSIDGQVIMDVAEQGPYIQPITRQTVALRGSVGAVSRSVVVFDNVQVYAELPTLPITALNVNLLRQTEPEWNQLEYDSAHLWSSTPTINRWGCAVTSAAMVLRYYGINQLPAGQSLTPGSLNGWLNQQVDGYFGGNVNWLAITRLTQLVSNRLNTPKLEFSRADGTADEITTFAKEEILANKPVILGYPGHFFVADGIDTPNNTLLIKDPYYSFTSLNQHQHKNEVNTIRRFQPSHTDLSYILVKLPSQMSIQMSDENGHILQTPIFTDFLQDPTNQSSEVSPTFQSVLIQKPETGVYRLQVFQPHMGQFNLKIYSYDTNGNVAVQDESGSVGPQGKVLTLNYLKTGGSASPTPSPIPSPTSSPRPDSSSERHQMKGIAQLLEEIRYLQFLIQSFKRSRIFGKTAIYQPLFQRLERLKERTNWRNN